VCFESSLLNFFKIDTRTLPVFSTSPSILFIDLDLEPGETKQCKIIIEIDIINHKL